MLGRRCCCPNYPGELFNFTCTIDDPWNNGLSNSRNALYKTWMKTVNQEVLFKRGCPCLNLREDVHVYI